MLMRRLAALLLSWALLILATPAAAQRGQASQPVRPQPDPDTVALVQLVDATIVAAPAPRATDQTQGDIAVKWEAAHFIKGQNGSYMPFTVSFDPSLVRSSEIAVYIRAVDRKALPAVAAALTPSAQTAAARAADATPPRYAWDNVHFAATPTDGRITRAIAIPPGQYELFVTVKERTSAAPNVTSTPPTAPPLRTGLLRHPVDVPDFNRAELQTSSVLLASAVQPVTGQLTPAEQEANPYVFGPMRIVPARSARFGKGGDLQLLFWINGATAKNGGKPDVTISYSFYLKQPDGEKYFNKTEPQELNAATLPPEFSMAAGHQLPGSLIVPLMSFPPGDYRLEIKVTDKPSGKVVTQNVAFSVTG
jgi:hypothetical protein